eukprot:403374837
MYTEQSEHKLHHQANHQGYLPISNQKIDVKGSQIEQKFLEQNKDIRTQVKAAIPRYMQIIIHEDYLRSCMKQSQVLIENQFNTYETIINQQMQDLKNNVKVYQDQIFTVSQDFIGKNAFIRDKLDYINVLENDLTQILQDFKNTQEEIQDLEEYSLSQQEICFESLREGLDSGYVPDSILYEFQDFLRGEQEIQSTIQTQNSQFTQRQNELKDLKNNTQNNQQVIKTSPRQGLSQSNQKEPKQFKIIADRTQHQDFMGQDSVVSSQQNLQLFTIGNKIQNYQDDIDSEFANNSIKKSLPFRITDFTQQQNRPTTNFNPLTSFVALNKQNIPKIQKQQNQYYDISPFDQVVTPIKRRDQISQEKTKGLHALQTSENIRDSVEVQKAQTDKNQKLKHLFHENQLSPRALFHHKNELSQQQKFHQLGDDKAIQIQKYLDNLIGQGETLFLRETLSLDIYLGIMSFQKTLQMQSK